MAKIYEHTNKLFSIDVSHKKHTHTLKCGISVEPLKLSNKKSAPYTHALSRQTNIFFFTE